MGPEVVEGLNTAYNIAEKDFRGLVVANEGQNFSAGANLAMLFMFACEQEWDEINMMIAQFQNTMRKARFSSVPVVVARHRADFETMYRALARRNEPVAVPEAMGACLIKGLVNWDRVARYRAAWAGPEEPSEARWQEEFRRLARRKELYQDRVLLLSTGPYAALEASELGLGDEQWLADCQWALLNKLDFIFNY